MQSGRFLSAPRRSRRRPPQYLFRSHVLHQFVLIKEVSRGGFALAKELFGLIVPVATVFVIALSKRNDRDGLRRVGHHHYLRRSLSAGANHLFAGRTKA